MPRAMIATSDGIIVMPTHLLMLAHMSEFAASIPDRKCPMTSSRRFAGFSIGKWRYRRRRPLRHLVVETRGMKVLALRGSGIPMHQDTRR